MKIVQVTPYVIKIRTNARGGVYWFFVKVETDNNITGWGEIYWNSFEPGLYKKMVMAVADEFLIGEDPFSIEKFFIRVFTKLGHWHGDLALTGIVSGLEMACWDIMGKALDRPVYDLLGGKVNERIRTYSYLTEKNDAIWCEDYWQMEDALLERAHELVEMGFTGIKLDPFSPYVDNIAPSEPNLQMLSRSVRTIRRLREEVCGDRCDIIIGTHGQFTASGAIRVARQLEPYDPLWFEEPTPPENYLALKKVSKKTSIPIAAGERLATKWEYMPLINSQSVDIVQLDVSGMGGLLEAKKIAAIADAAHMQITPHFWAGPINFAAQIQLDVTCTNFLIQESIEKMDTHGLDTLLKKPFVWEDGYIIPSNEPGLGIELDEELVEKYSIDSFDEKNILL
jgi:galactonate dehydratase